MFVSLTVTMVNLIAAMTAYRLVLHREKNPIIFFMTGPTLPSPLPPPIKEMSCRPNTFLSSISA